MCFSATASFVVGGALTAVGVVTLTKARNKKELPFAAIPLIFGIQQIVEGFVWLSFGWDPGILHVIASYLYFMFATIWWPVFLPFAILFIEPIPWRSRIMWVLELAGIAVGLRFIYFMFTSPVTSSVVNECIRYSYPASYQYTFTALYIAVVCISCLLSSKKIIRLFGILTFLSLVAAYTIYTETFVSVWCFFAAVLSFIVYLYLDQSAYKGR